MREKVCAIVMTVASISAIFATGCADSVRYGKYANAELYEMGSASFAAEQVRKIEIDWVGGNIEVEQSSDTVEVLEDKESSKDEERMRYYLDGDVLKIKYCKSGLRGSIPVANKHLRVGLPVGIDLEIDNVDAVVTVGVIEMTDFSVGSVSGKLMAERIVCNEADVETVSGNATIGELIATEFALETISGDISVSRLSADFLEASTTSGDLTFGLQKAVKAKDGVESMSGDITIVTNGLGGQIRFETANGIFSCDLEYGKVGSRYDIMGTDGTAVGFDLEIDTFSGNVFVK